MSVFESGRRLCVFFEAGRSRFAMEATSITEVANPDGGGQRLRGSLVLEDLSCLLGGPPEVRPGTALVLDTSPTLVVRVRGIVEVADAASGTAFVLSSALGRRVGPAIRAAVRFKDRVFWELHADAIPQTLESARTLADSGEALSPVPLKQPPERALVLESHGRYFGVPLGWVSQVIPVPPSLCSLPAPMGPVAGVLANGNELWAVHSLPAWLGGEPTLESLVVLGPAAPGVGLSAQRALGVFEAFRPAAEPGFFTTRRVDRPVLFLDLPLMFT